MDGGAAASGGDEQAAGSDAADENDHERASEAWTQLYKFATIEEFLIGQGGGIV